MFKNLVILMLAFIIMYLTNPGEERFREYYGKRIEEVQSEGDWKGKLIGEGKKLNALINVEREDKVIYSIYKVDFMGREERYLGIFTRFVDISRKDEEK